jgi:hypothetical protein
MGLQYGDIDDAVILTQNNYVKKGGFVDMQTDLTNHIGVREIWGQRKKVFDGGENWEFQIQMDHNHSARTVGLYETDGSSLNDTMVMGEVAARHVNAHYIYDQREKAFQRGAHAIVDLVKTRYVAMMVSWYELLEEILWGKPVDSSDVKTPFGVAYWVTKSVTEGFNGGNPTGFTAGRAGVDSGTHTRFKNWTAQYAAVSKDDLVRKMRKAHRNIMFKSPVDHAKPDMGMGNGIYVNDSVIGLLEEILETQNMNLGNDLASKDGKTMFKGTPLTYAPKLDDDSTNPVYMLDWKSMQCGVMSGWEKNLSDPQPVPGKHLVRRVDLDASLNIICTNVRNQAVLSLSV